MNYSAFTNRSRPKVSEPSVHWGSCVELHSFRRHDRSASRLKRPRFGRSRLKSPVTPDIARAAIGCARAGPPAVPLRRRVGDHAWDAGNSPGAPVESYPSAVRVRHPLAAPEEFRCRVVLTEPAIERSPQP